ncbi:MAG: LysR family transcriptional regulator [Cryomorphaceae bacterium]|nr:LysR family transcriptional regulator [Cryomorphaceae bacterium]
MLSIQQMQYILSLSEHKQFQKASESCFVTQPTLSMQVKKAEDFLGYPIFDRSRSPLELTIFGEELIPVIREILSENDKIGSIAKKMKGEFKEQIRIGIIPTIAAYMVLDLFTQRCQSTNDPVVYRGDICIYTNDRRRKHLDRTTCRFTSLVAQ